MSNAALRQLPSPAGTRLFYILALWLTITLPQAVYAHDPTPVVAVATLTHKHQLAVRLEVHLESALPTLVTGDGQADRSFETMYPDELTTEFTRVRSRFLQAVTPVADGTTGRQVLTAIFNDLHIPPTADENNLRRSVVTLTIAIPEKAETLQWYWPKPLGELHLQVKSADGLELLTTVVPEGSSSALFDLNQSAATRGSTFLNYLRSGFRHILPLGLDHLLFIVGLVILSLRWQDLVAQITVFTVAHTLTLALGSTGVVPAAPAIVEPLIALSIVYIAIENLLGVTVSRKRLLVIFVFGLLHGLGFALVLDTLGMSTATFIIALLGFNLGVELGQLSVAAACLLLITLVFGRRADSGDSFSAHDPGYRRWLVIPVSALIGATGLYWLVLRLIG